MSEEKTSEVNIVCKGCGWVGPPEACPPSVGVYHDLCCPECGTTRLDTSQLRIAWEKDGHEYGYGDDNFLQSMRGNHEG